MSELDPSQVMSRLAVLEDWRMEQREWMNEMRTAMAGINATIQSQRLCATPNTCVTLKREIDDRKKEIDELAQENINAMKRIESLEKWRVFIMGIIATVGVMWAILQVIIPWGLKMVEFQ